MAVQVPYCSSTTNTLSAIPITSTGPPASTYSTGCTGGGIDCSTWTSNMLLQEQESGIQAPNLYYLGDQYNLLTGTPELFASSVQSVLPLLANNLVSYFSQCSSPAPCPTPSSCPPLSFSVSLSPPLLLFRSSMMSEPLCLEPTTSYNTSHRSTLVPACCAMTTPTPSPRCAPTFKLLRLAHPPNAYRKIPTSMDW